MKPMWAWMAPIVVCALGTAPPSRGEPGAIFPFRIEQATLETIDFNELCTMMYKAHVLGNPKPILPEDMEARRTPLPGGRRLGNAGGRVGMLSRWRYFTNLEEEKAAGGRQSG